MRRGRVSIALLALLLAACSREPAPDPEITAAVEQFDAQQRGVESGFRQLLVRQPENEPDFRGRTISQDLDQWVMTSSTRDELQALRDRALKSTYPNDARQLLASAESLLKQEADRSNGISKYWFGSLPAPYWRRHWQSLFDANELPAEDPDGMLLDIEGHMRKSLDAGDFSAAAGIADELNSVLAESRDRATTRILQTRKTTPTFRPRSSVCVPSALTGDRSERPRLIRGESVDRFYPAAAISRGEQGAVVLRARIDGSGCARSVAVVVHSGVPSLDDAALAWFETAEFAPAVRGGAPVDSELTWKVRFVLKS